MSTHPQQEIIQEVTVTREGLDAVRRATIAEIGTWSTAKRVSAGIEEAYQSLKHLDPVQINLAKLERLSPGSVVTLPSGEKWICCEGITCNYLLLDEDAPRPETLSMKAALPLLKACVEAGAEVALAGEESTFKVSAKGIEKFMADLEEEESGATVTLTDSQEEMIAQAEALNAWFDERASQGGREER
jgi:hypothetical protein